MRQTTYTPEIAAKFCAAIAEGGTLRAVCAKPGMPAKATIFRWLREQPEFVKLYEQATDDRADAHVEEIIEIADKCAVDKDAVAKAKLQIYARIEAVQKMKPKKYGQRVNTELTGPNGGPVEITAITRRIVKANE